MTENKVPLWAGPARRRLAPNESQLCRFRPAGCLPPTRGTGLPHPRPERDIREPGGRTGGSQPDAGSAPGGPAKS